METMATVCVEINAEVKREQAWCYVNQSIFISKRKYRSLVGWLYSVLSVYPTRWWIKQMRTGGMHL